MMTRETSAATLTTNDKDAFLQVTEDPVDFYTHGHGGFEHGTSHVPRGDARSELSNRAEQGNPVANRRIVEAAEERGVSNHAGPPDGGGLQEKRLCEGARVV